MSQLESEKRYLDKSNRHLENILEATNAYKKQEVSELNRIHVETLKVSGCWHLHSNHWGKLTSPHSIHFSLTCGFSNKHSLLSFKYLFYQILTTPTKAYNLRSRLVPLSSPDHLNGTDNNADDIWSEQPPSDMSEMALTEELRQVQVQQRGLSLKCVYKKNHKVLSLSQT